MSDLDFLGDSEGNEDSELMPFYAGHYEKGLVWLGMQVERKAGDEEPEEDPAKKDTEFTASTSTVDRHGDSVDQQTWKLANFVRNPVILADHWGDVVGRSRKTWRQKAEDGKTVQSLRIRVQWDDSEVNPKGMLLAHQHRNKFRNAVSVGFYPHKITNRTKLPTDHALYVDPNTVAYSWLAGYLYQDNELLEVSSVGVPANPEALQLSLDTWRAESTDSALARYFNETVERRVAELLTKHISLDAEVRKQILALVYSGKTPSNNAPNNNHKSGDSLPFVRS